MSGENWLIRNGRVLDPKSGTDVVADVRVRNGVVAELGQGLESRGETPVDASGCLVAPGLIDLHVHLREPGQTHKETIATGTRAAASGGFVAVACMPNTEPALDSPELIESVQTKAREAAFADVYPIAAITKGRRGTELSPVADLLSAGAKGFTDDGTSVMDANLMREVLINSRHMDFSVLVHCEDPMLARNGSMNLGAVSRELRLPGLAGLAEERMIARDIHLAEETHGTLHILHVTTRRGVELIRAAKERGIRVTAEACPHHFILTDEAVRTHGTNAKMNPPLRTRNDVDGIIEGLCDGTLDVIATDHAPHSSDEKAKDMADAPFGIIGSELCVPLTWTYLVETGKLSPMDVIFKMTVAPAQVLRVEEPRIVEGMPANLTVIDPSLALKVTHERLHSKSRNTPFLGETLRGWPLWTVKLGRETFRRREAEGRFGK